MTFPVNMIFYNDVQKFRRPPNNENSNIREIQEQKICEPFFVHCYSLYRVFPAMAPRENTTRLAAIRQFLPIEGGSVRSAAEQTGYQLAALTVTLAIAVVSGLVTGKLQSLYYLPCGYPGYLWLSVKNNFWKKYHKTCNFSLSSVISIKYM